MSDYRVPTEWQREILMRNGIDPDSVAVMEDRGKSLVLLVYKTRDTIWIHEGDRKWRRDGRGKKA